MRAFRRVAALLFCGLFCGVAFGHPMGNLSVNHYARLEPGAKGVDVLYVLDLAEIPTFELTQSWNVPKDAEKAALALKATEQAREWVSHLSFTEGGKALPPRIGKTELSIVEGAGNLPVFRIATTLHVPATGGHVEYEDHNYPTRAGWREIVVKTGDGADITKTSKGDADVSQGLTSYPQDPTKAPPQDVRAWFDWAPDAASPVTKVRKPLVVVSQNAVPAAAPASADAARDVRPPEQQSMGTVKRNDAISNILRMKTISWPVMFTLIGLAFWFGALHALEPGHGKTMVAAYLVGSRGTPKHAMLLGGMVTFTHTVSVFILGFATMFLSHYILPDKISRVLGIVSGISIIWIGGMLLWRRARGLRPAHSHDHHHDHGHSHEHDHHHDHDHGEHSHTHSHDDHSHSHSHGGLTHTHDGHTHSHVPEGDISMGSLMALGASGGLVPCPSALILLLSAISIGRIGLGLVLLVSFSLGLAIVLMATGMAVLFAKNFLPERQRTDSGFFRYMPIFSAAAILVIGVMMTSVSLGWITPTRFFG